MLLGARMKTPFLVAALSIATGCTAAGDDADLGDDGKGDGSTTPAYVSATTVEDAGDALTDTTPALAPHLKPMGSLGHYGPIGEYGPLGVLGPVGDSSWSPSSWISGGTGWDAWSRLFTALDGPLGPDGPLGSRGPLSSTWWQGQGLGDVGRQLGAGGATAALGPLGPLGALGPLGPLGPIGAHGFSRNSRGEYVGDCTGDGRTAVCRTIDVEWSSGQTRTWPLFERYSEDVAKAQTNDTSFMVEGGLSRAGDTDRYAVTSADAQWVTVVAVPEHALHTYPQAMAILGAAIAAGLTPPALVPFAPFYPYDHYASFDDLDVELDVDGIGTAVSASGDGVDWIQARVPAGARIEIRVSLERAWAAWWRPYLPRYRLFVVGSTKYLAGGGVSGPQLVRL